MTAIITIICSAVIYYCGYRYGTVKTARKWTTYIREKCVRVDLLTKRIGSEFGRARENAPEGMPVVIAEDSLIRIIDDVLRLQNR